MKILIKKKSTGEVLNEMTEYQWIRSENDKNAMKLTENMITIEESIFNYNQNMECIARDVRAEISD